MHLVRNAWFAAGLSLVAVGCDDKMDDAREHGHDSEADEHADNDRPTKPQADAAADADTQAEPVDAGVDAGEPATKDAAPADAPRDAGSDTSTEAVESEPSKAATYVLSVIVFGPDVTTTYVTLVDSLDAKEIDFKRGIELGGQANVAVHNGRLFISDGEEPLIKRYQLKAGNELEEDGVVSFANFGESSVSVDDTVNTFVSKTKAYITGEGGTTVVWNPEAMEIVGEIPVELPEASAMSADWTLSGSSGFARGNKLYRTLFWFDWNSYAFSDAQYFVVYDTDKDEVVSVEPESRCPGLSAQVAADEKGNAYFSNWFYNLAGTLQKGRPSACALRLAAGSDTLDADWTLDFKKLTGGHEGAQLSYTKDQHAVFAAFHEEEIEVKADDSPYEIVSGPHWEAWQLDLKTQKAAPVKGIERMGAQQTVFTLDGRTFLFAPNQAFDLTKVHEILPDGTSRKAFEIKGWSRAFLKLK
jgi:hypothetical protein